MKFSHRLISRPNHINHLKQKLRQLGATHPNSLTARSTIRIAAFAPVSVAKSALAIAIRTNG
ncbi:MAG: hypothetical protein CMO60_06635 [Verrucomicrobiales bacterium]|nr:hypothetical protein [Verrucomicrobiales bacterium]